jgi:hypothetical protein
MTAKTSAVIWNDFVNVRHAVVCRERDFYPKNGREGFTCRHFDWIAWNFAN